MRRNLIDRDALIASIPKTNVDIFENCRNCTTLCDWQVKELIEQAESVDAVEVKHGTWINKYPLSTCSVCSATMILNDYGTYCPNCGAVMKGAER